jgi:acyl carrier protein
MATYEEVDTRTRKVIAERTNRGLSDIKSEQDLANDLGFTELGKRALSTFLNKEFEKESLLLTPDDISPCKTVGDVIDLVWKKLPQKSRQP